MQVAESKSDLGGEEFSLVFVEPFYLYQVSEQFASCYEFHDEVYARIVLEHVLHSHNERMGNVEKNVFFELDIVELLVVNDDIFPDALHRVELPIPVVLDEEDLAESALADHFEDLEVLELGLLVGLLLEHERGGGACPGLGLG